MITVLYDRVLVRPSEAKEVTSGGIVLASGSTEKNYEAEVLAVGNGRVTKDGLVIPLTVKVGDVVLYNVDAGHAVKIDGEDLVALNEDDIYAVVPKE